MSKTIIIDSGVLVALLSHNDEYHSWAVEVVSGLQRPFLTCEAVMAETCFLLRRNGQNYRSLFTLLEREAIVLAFNLAQELSIISDLMTKYENVPMSLADACLVRMAEFYPNTQVLTLDGDFKIYRINRDQVIPIISL